MELLYKLYYDEKTGFQSKEKLYHKAKALEPSITHRLVKEFFDNQATV